MTTTQTETETGAALELIGLIDEARALEKKINDTLCEANRVAVFVAPGSYTAEETEAIRRENSALKKEALAVANTHTKADQVRLLDLRLRIKSLREQIKDALPEATRYAITLDGIGVSRSRIAHVMLGENYSEAEISTALKVII